MSSFSGDVFVTLETSDGTVRKFKAITASFEQRFDMIEAFDYGDRFASYIPGRKHTRFEFEAVDEVITTMDNLKSTASVFKVRNEWKCEFCGSVHPRKETGCKKCGAPRSFLYED